MLGFFEFYSTYVDENSENIKYAIDISKQKQYVTEKSADVFPIRDPFDENSRPGARPFNLIDKRIVRNFFWEDYKTLNENNEAN